jgi:ADP-dependent phosphofructokinase/glucokinase
VISPTHRPLLTTHNTHKAETYMLLAVFEPAIPASERKKTHAMEFGTEVASKRKMRRVHKILAGKSEGKITLKNLGIDEWRIYGR